MIQFFAISLVIVSALMLILHKRFDAAIRRILPLSVDNAMSRKAAVEKYHRLDRLRITAGCGVIICYAICGILWIVPGWSGITQLGVILAASAILFATCMIVARHNFHRDYC